jgi:hypothetical protein
MAAGLDVRMATLRGIENAFDALKTEAITARRMNLFMIVFLY